MTKLIRYIAWPSFILALCAWGAVFYAGSFVLNEAHARAEVARNSVQASDRAALTQRISILAQETKSERAAFNSVVGVDLVDVARLIEDVARNEGVVVEISSANPGDVVDLGNEHSATEYSFVVQARGDFTELARAVAALENMPLVSSVSALEFQSIQKAEKDPWGIVVRLSVLIADTNI